MLNKNVKLADNKKSAQEMQDDIFRHMKAEQRLILSLKINGEIFNSVSNRIKLQHSNLHFISLSQKIYKEFDARCKYYNDLFEQKLAIELKRVNFENF